MAIRVEPIGAVAGQILFLGYCHFGCPALILKICRPGFNFQGPGVDVCSGMESTFTAAGISLCISTVSARLSGVIRPGMQDHFFTGLKNSSRGIDRQKDDFNRTLSIIPEGIGGAIRQVNADCIFKTNLRPIILS
jgi:hypothetical protein